MTLQRGTYARHQHVTPQGHEAHSNKIVRVRWWCACGHGAGVVYYYYYYFTFRHNPLEGDGGVGQEEQDRTVQIINECETQDELDP